MPKLNQPVSVIVPAYNAEATIGACVRALCQQSYALAYEIIVVDDGSEDSTASVAQEAGAHVIRTKRGRPAAARNVGIEAATGDIICCTDADCVPAVDWLAEITKPFVDPEVAAAKGTYATEQRSLVARFVQLEYEDKYDHMADEATIDFIDTYSAAYRRAVLTESGGFDRRFDYLEDQELSFRLAAAGHKMVFQPTAVVTHRHANTLLAYVRKKFTIGYWKAQVVRRYPDRVVRDSHTPQVVKVQMLLAALALAALAVLTGAWIGGWTPGVRAGLVTFGVALLAFLITALPFCIKAWPKDRTVAIAAPGLLLARAISLGLGTAWGILSPPASLRGAAPTQLDGPGTDGET